MSPLFLSALCLCLGSASAAPTQDAVLSLPEYGAPPTPQYSGFLDASAADYEAGVQLHYWLATSSSPDQATAPVVLWLNGGPGSSSILGMLQEHGPLIMNATGGLTENPYTWTKDVSERSVVLQAACVRARERERARARDCPRRDTPRIGAPRIQHTSTFPALRALRSHLPWVVAFTWSPSHPVPLEDE